MVDRATVAWACAATTAVGTVFSITAPRWADSIGITVSRSGAGVIPPIWLGLVPGMIGLAAAGAALLPRRIAGWPTAAVGCCTVCLLLLLEGADQPFTRPAPPSLLLTAAAVGLALSGPLTEFARPDGAIGHRRRLALGLGFVFGFLAGPAIETTPSLALSRPHVRIIAIVTAVVVAMAALDLAQRRHDERRPANAATHLAALIAAVTASAFLLDQVRAAIIVDLRDTGSVSAVRLETVELVASYGGMLIAIAVGWALLRYALRTAGTEAARWMLTCCGLAFPMCSLHALPETYAPVICLLTAAGAGAGARLARLASGRVPWDSVGLLLIAPAIVGLDVPSLVDDDLTNQRYLTPWLVVLVGFTLGAGFARVVGQLWLHEPGAQRALIPGDILLGFVAFTLVGMQLAPMSVVRSEISRLELPTMGGTTFLLALLLTIMFMTGRRRKATAGVAGTAPAPPPNLTDDPSESP
ncbi:MAG: hypothetical protein JXA67_09315 [Micromonosporaceae bacterium]|nr:hypothetical protein [Micromonosporaceae bacterium]